MIAVGHPRSEGEHQANRAVSLRMRRQTDRTQMATDIPSASPRRLSTECGYYGWFPSTIDQAGHKPGRPVNLCCSGIRKKEPANQTLDIAPSGTREQPYTHFAVTQHVEVPSLSGWVAGHVDDALGPALRQEPQQLRVHTRPVRVCTKPFDQNLHDGRNTPGVAQGNLYNLVNDTLVTLGL
jgi:hypothetical protein